MVKNHLKRINAPATWQIARKKTKFVARQHSGGHSLEYSMPISVIFIEVLNICTTMKEFRFMLREKSILVNQKPVIERNLSVGLFDTIAAPLLGKQWRMVINQKRKLDCIPISEASSKILVGKVVKKSTLKTGKLQLSLMNGRSIRVEKDEYKIGDSILIALPSQDMKGILHIEKGAITFVFKGSHTGKVITIDSISDGIVSFKDGDEHSETRKDFIIAIGDAMPELKVV